MNEQEKDFLKLFPASIFVSIPLAGGGLTHTKSLSSVMSLNARPERPAGAYFTVNGFNKFEEGSHYGRTKENVTLFNASFLDIDLTPETRRMEAEALLMELRQKGLPPTAMVLTGKGMHVYWVYEEPIPFSQGRLKEYEALQLAIVEHFKSRGADPQARDAARVLRIPGGRYWNKDGTEGERIELMHLEPSCLYKPAQLAEYFKDTIKLDTKVGEDLVRLTSAGEVDLSKFFNVKKGTRHHDAYSAALSIIQSAKSLVIARKWYQAVLTTWDTPDSPMDWKDRWAQFEEAKKFLEKDRPQLFLGDEEGSNIAMSVFEDVEEKPIEWLWDGYMARGKVHMLTGDPGLGKSQITIDIAARLSTGSAFPSRVLSGGSKRPPLGVIILSAEDDAADTIRPRLRAAGADLTKVIHMSSVIAQRDAKGVPKMRALALRDDAEQILKAIRQFKFEIGLIIIDPISAFLSSSQDSNSNSDARGTLAQLQSIIMDKGISMLMINHNNKNTGAKSAHMRSMGSVGWNAASRATFYVFKDRNDERRRVFSVGKMNLAKDTEKGFFFRVEEKKMDVAGQETGVPFIQWDQEAFPTMSADEYSAQKEGPQREEPKSTECEREMEEYLVGKGDVTSKEVMSYMKERGFSQAEIYRTARRLSVIGEYGIWRIQK